MARVPSDDEIGDVLERLDAPQDALRLAVGRATIPLTSLDKVLWPDARPAQTKRDLLRYLARVSPAMLRHLAGRPVFVSRFPHGAGGESFYQKVWEEPPAFVHQRPVWSSDRGEARPLLFVDNLATLLWLGQQAALEYHVWFSRVTVGPDGRNLPTDYASGPEALAASRLNYPDFLVVDLDAYDYSGREAPGDEPELHRRGFHRVRTVALEVRRVAEALGLSAFVKTSGRTGLHLYLPIRRVHPYEEVRAMAQTLGNFLRALRPDDVTVAWAVRERSGRVFFDANQNVRGKSLAAPFSPRRHAAATVSMPVSWESLPGIYPTDFTLATAPSVLETHGDPWAEILHAKQDMDQLLAGAGSDA